MSTLTRWALLVIQAFVAVTATMGGTALVLGSLNPGLRTVLVPSGDFLQHSPFPSFVVPGILLIALVGGTHAGAFVVTLRRGRSASFLSAAGGFGCVIWIFVQMIYIPFSFLQALYFATGCMELGLVLLGLGVLPLREAGQRAAVAS